MIHHTRGVYNNGSFKDNGVKSEHLASHIWYNLIFRPGRAFFVDGFCLNEGYLDKETIADIVDELENNPVIKTSDTAPYV